MIDCFEGMGQILDTLEGMFHSEGLRSLQGEIRKAQNDPMYQSLLKELPVMLSKLQGSASITIGIDLDTSLRPIQLTLLVVKENHSLRPSFLRRLFGVRTNREGIAPLHSAPQHSSELGGAVDPMLVPLFADLAKVVEKTAIPIADQLNEYADFHGSLFTELRHALIFYLGAVRFIRLFEKPWTAHVSTTARFRRGGEMRCEKSYIFNLVLRHMKPQDGAYPTIVITDILIGPTGQILILTGPNGGGKTTYMQGVGVVHILAQLGCYVPGKQAIISPLENIFTHFPSKKSQNRTQEDLVRKPSGSGRYSNRSPVIVWYC